MHSDHDTCAVSRMGLRLVCLLAFSIGTSWWSWSPVVMAQELAYMMQENQKFSFDVTITVEEDDKTLTYRGLIHYTVQSGNNEQIRLTYRGGLNEITQAKSNRRNDASFGLPFPRGPRFMGPPSPFARTTFAGKVQTTNRIIMTPKGRVLNLEGDSQLPYLLGNVSLLPFESLPKAEQKEWVLDSSISITEEQEDRHPFGSFGPFGPRGLSGEQNKSVQAATEITRYSIIDQDGDLITIKKSTQLVSPAAADESFEMNGAGTWQFDRKEHLPSSLDMTAKLIVKSGNSSTTYPITIKYTRLSREALEKIEAEARRVQEETKRRMEEEKTRAETPLTAAEKAEALTALSSNNPAELKRILVELAKKSLLDNDPEIAAAITPHINHADDKVGEEARKALAKWSSTFKRREELRKAYQGPSPVTSTNREVDSTTPLFVGQLLQAEEGGAFWYPVRIKSLLPNGRVEVEYLRWGQVSRSATLMRRNLQLAPDELEQPNQPANQSATASSTTASATSASSTNMASAAKHTWSDATGRFKIEAVFEQLKDGQVHLMRTDGKAIKVPLEKLSKEDQALVKKLVDEANENPFEPK